MAKRPVILFKSPQEDVPLSSDPYYSSFTSQGYGPLAIITVIGHAFVNVSQLSDVINAGPQDRYGGVIITSGRAAEAWKHAAERTVENSGAFNDCSWSTTPFYVVGPRTGSLIRNGSSTIQHLLPDPSHVLGGAQSGNAEKLSEFIVSDYNDRGISLPMLYLTGDKNKDTVPRTLKQHGIPYEELKVYETSPRAGEAILHDIREFKGSLQQSDTDVSTWIVFFAPSSAAAALPHVQEYYDLPGLESTPLQTDAPSKRHTLIAAIGPTTSSYLTETRKLQVNVISPSPSADSLAIAIHEYDTKDEST
ncbi:hypothetical protein FRC03_009125 [Tulasnella sp. 419]|nr:hypothetical protein FRC03_009125 [Tulasnella sp. 419]